MKAVILFFIFIVVIHPPINAQQKSNKNFLTEIKAPQLTILLTFPRSGTNLISCYIQAITRMPIRWSPKSPAINRLNLKLDHYKDTLVRYHKGYKIEKLNKNGNKLIFILRNYKEAIHRASNVDDPDKFKNLFVDDSPVFQQYIKNIKVFHHWDKSNRLIIYYENLIVKPLPEVRRVLKFLGEEEPENLTEDFLKDVAKKALESYHQQHIGTGGAQSKGTDLLYHSKKMPTNCLIEIDKWIEMNFPNIWKAYLQRYQTK